MYKTFGTVLISQLIQNTGMGKVSIQLFTYQQLFSLLTAV